MSVYHSRYYSFLFFIQLWLLAFQLFNIHPILIDHLYLSPQKHCWILPLTGAECMRLTKMALSLNWLGGGEADKCPNVAFQWENGEKYQGAFTLLNEVVGFLMSPGTATETFDHLQPQFSWQSLVTAFTAQDSGISQRREMVRLFSFDAQCATAGVKTSFRQPCKRFCSSALSSGIKKCWKPKETWMHRVVGIAESDQLVLPSRDEKFILKEAGLGKKRITFDKYGNCEQFHSSLLKEFPKLSEGGGNH